MRRFLRKDPIAEAVCEFRFDAPDWDWTVPGLVWAQIKDDFPKKEEQTQIEFQVDTTSEGVVPNAQTGIGRMQFWREDRTALVQVGPEQLSIHQMKPYTGWPNFSRIIGQVLESYERAAPFKAINRVTLRYINRLPLPPAPFRIPDVLNTYPQLPEEQGQEHQLGSWMQRVEILRPEKGAVFIVQAGFIPRLQPGVEPDPLAPPHLMMLDLLFAHVKPEPLPKASVANWLNDAHAEIEAMFFGSLQPNFLQMLGPEEEEIYAL